MSSEVPDYGLLETALYVEEPVRSERFYRDLLGAKPKLRVDRLHALELADGRILLLFRRGASISGEDTPGGKIPGHDGRGTLHLAFQTGELEIWRRRIGELGLTVESEVHPAQGGRSLYLRDPDGHVIEFAERAIWDELPPVDEEE